MASATVGAIDDHERQPIMPHNALTQEELDRDYPSIAPPEADQLDDIANDSDDKVFQAGMREVEKIRQTMKTQGRRRRPINNDEISLCVDAIEVVIPSQGSANTLATTTTTTTANTPATATTTTTATSQNNDAESERKTCCIPSQGPGRHRSHVQRSHWSP
jgi:hypothetical protein